MMIRRNDEDGIALVTVLLVTMVLLLAVAGSMAYAIGSLPLSKHDQDWNAALAAAEAGIDDYIFRLNENDQYYLYSATTLPPDGNQAFTTWVTVPHANTGASMRYSVDTTNLSSQGAIVLTATGRSGQVTRSVQATIRRRAFIDYVYFTDYETLDPTSYPDPGFNSNNSAWAQTNCAKHWYDPRVGGPPYDNSHCVDLNFVSADTINGALHTNDALLINGSPTFTGNVTTSWNPASGNKWRANGSATPSFKPGDPKYAAPLAMPPSNVAIKAEADASVGGTGCLYTGPTSITLNAAGTMNVTSPFTRSSNCATGLNQPLPVGGVIYVQNVPAAPADPNYTAGCTNPATGLAFNVTAPGGGVTHAHPLGYPQQYDPTVYGCRSGDVFIQGVLKGRLTVAADNNIEIIGNLTYSGGAGGNDILGLIANNYIDIYHPVGPTGTPGAACDGAFVSGFCDLIDKAGGLATAFRTPTIFGAVLAIQHSFRVQNFDVGDDANLGAITLTGAIAQRYRGAVGVSATSGYGKAYGYDQRLSYQSPPHFLTPVASAWRIATWIEQKAAYAWNAP